MNKAWLAGLALVSSMMGVNMIGSPVAMAAGYSMSAKEIDINGSTLSRPSGIVYQGTTYMPIFYINQALQKLNVTGTWDGTSWKIGAPGVTVAPNPHPGSNPNRIYVNGVLLYSVKRVVAVDPDSGVKTTFMPVWYIMQVLTKAGIVNAWDGHKWAIKGTTSDPNGTGSPVEANGGIPKITLQNGAQDDSAYWKQASDHFYLQAYTTQSYDSRQGTPIINAEPGQTLYLMAYSDTEDIAQLPQWSVNSTAATITNTPNIQYTVDNHAAQTATVVASQPGIYTVQASFNGEYSIPLVLIVGLNQLKGTTISIPQAGTGVLPLPTNLPDVAAQPADTMKYVPFQPITGGWLPVSGQVTNGAKSVTVDFTVPNSNAEWNYQLPVNADGTFGGLVRVPFQGDVTVAFYTDYVQMLNDMLAGTSNGSTTAYYSINIPDIAPTENQRALLATGVMDVNMSNEFAQTTSVLLENSPSLDTGIAAVSNYVAETVVYDWANYNAGKSIWTDSTTIWNHPLGVCQDIAELTSTMLKSVGIPAETVSGVAPPGKSTTDDHEWLRAWDGSQWIVNDPTWDSANGNVNVSLNNEFYTNTHSLQATHSTDTSSIGAWS